MMIMMMKVLSVSNYLSLFVVQLWLRPAVMSGLRRVLEWRHSTPDDAGSRNRCLPATATHRRKTGKLSYLKLRLLLRPWSVVLGALPYGKAGAPAVKL